MKSLELLRNQENIFPEELQSKKIKPLSKAFAKTLCDMGLSGTPILYGASVKGNNAAEIMSIPNVDGVLVGGASLKSDDFIPIITSVK